MRGELRHFPDCSHGAILRLPAVPPMAENIITVKEVNLLVCL
jgi:hypothetical protein